MLPLPVLEEIRNDLPAMAEVGISALEISHRSTVFGEILADAESDIRVLLRVPNTHHILFLQGGASLQFSMVPMNFLPPGGTADYFLTGTWAKKAVDDAKKVGTVAIAASTEADAFSRVPDPGEWTLDPKAAYVHMTTNETIAGIEWHHEPDTGGDRGVGTGDLVLEGTRAGQTQRFTYRVELPRRERGNAFIPRLWAARKAGWLTAQASAAWPKCRVSASDSR